MERTGYGRILPFQFVWIMYLCHVFPACLIKTFIELLVGSMLSLSGFVCRALLLIQYGQGWMAYYKWIERGQWKWLALARQIAGLVIRWFDEQVWHLIIDDTLMLRASKKAPGAAMHHPHGNKVNQADYVRAQCWVALALVVRHQAIPLLLRLAGRPGRGLFAATRDGRLFPASAAASRLLIYVWPTDRASPGDGLKVIGQVWIDTTLFEVPCPSGKRGRPCKYGERIEVDQ